MAAVSLHNLLRKNNITPTNHSEDYDANAFSGLSGISDFTNLSAGKIVQEKYRKYFVDQGAVGWQNNYANVTIQI